MPIIEVDHLSKEYRLGAMQGLKQTLLNTSARLRGKQVAERRPFKVLDDINFANEPGRGVSTIGHNGAGKSMVAHYFDRHPLP